MTRRNHKWNGDLKNKRRDSSSVYCLYCGMVRQYVGGFPTYFLNDTVYDKKAPSCSGINPEDLKKRQDDEWRARKGDMKVKRFADRFKK